LKSNHRSPPPAPQPPPSTHQFHTPRYRDTHTFRAPPQFEPQNQATYDHFPFQDHSRRLDHPNSNDFHNKDDVWHTHEQLPKWHPPRADLAKFDGTGVMDWIEDCEFFFDITHIYDNAKVSTVISYLVGEAREWYRYYKINNHNPYWSEFKDELLDRFNPDMKDLVDEFRKIHQEGRVGDYIRNYERINARVLAKQYAEEEFYLLGFLSGLNEEIADAVLLYSPTTLKQAYILARQVEKSIDSHNKMFKHLPKPSYSSHFQPKTYKSCEDPVPSSSSMPTQPIVQNSTKQLTLDQKKTLGLCFRCGEKIFPGHKCKIKGIHLLESEESAGHDSLLDEELVNDLSPSHTATITLCDAASHSNHNTLLFQGKIQLLDIIAMVDSGSTHSFINPFLLDLLTIPTQSGKLLSVTTASGTKMTTDLLCSQLVFQLQGHTFQSDLHVLPVSGHDMILGMDWLHKHSPVHFDSKAKTFTVHLENNCVTLQIKPLTASLTLWNQLTAMTKAVDYGISFFWHIPQVLRHLLVHLLPNYPWRFSNYLISIKISSKHPLLYLLPDLVTTK
jgi:Retroviral aspartyl protease/Ty3 transposon capsid-like protein